LEAIEEAPMKAWLVLQEGPGAGQSYLLDPFKQSLLSVGRSSECFVVLNDGRASRHHIDIRWDGRRWIVVDQGSTNGTYVNGLQIHHPYDLRLGDRLTIGETTLVLREFSPHPPAPLGVPRAAPARRQRAREKDRTAEMVAVGSVPPAAQRGQAGRSRQPLPRQGGAKPAPRAQPLAWQAQAFWLAQGVIALGVLCLAIGAFLPWVQPAGGLDPSAPADVIKGLEGYGRLTLVVAVIALGVWLADSFLPRLGRRTPWTGLAHVVLGALSILLLGSNLIAYHLSRGTSLLGVRLADRSAFAIASTGGSLDFLAGSILTIAGLGLLLAGGLWRLAWAIFVQNEQEERR
jgi:hypothetical protein